MSCNIISIVIDEEMGAYRGQITQSHPASKCQGRDWNDPLSGGRAWTGGWVVVRGTPEELGEACWWRCPRAPY